MSDNTGLKTSDYFYELPQELIAQDPLADRSASRLMLLDRATGAVSHHVFREIGDFLVPGDLLVINDTKVIPARLLGVKKDTGAAVEILLLRRTEETDSTDKSDAQTDISGKNEEAAKDGIHYSTWECLVKPGKKLREGATVVFGNDPYPLTAEITKVCEDGNRLVRFSFKGIWEEVLDALGEMPLPPYITHKLPRENRDRYQTVYARYEGSAAAPTAGLHFTPALLESLKEKGIFIATVTLHVGLGTFRPVKVENVEEHHMHSEWFRVTAETAEAVNRTKREGGRVICVGTTSCRTLESAAQLFAGDVSSGDIIEPCEGDTSIFIYPGYEFRVMNGLITNFHLPESTLLMLVSAFAGREHILAAYEKAVRERYRFFSFGDAMLII